MINLLVVILCNAFIAQLSAIDLGVQGHTFPIVERSMLELIQEQLQLANRDGRLAKFNNEIQQQAKDRIANPKFIANLKHTDEEREYLFDPSIILQHDITDHDGELIHQKGYKINPLSKISWGRPMLLIDGKSEEQVEFALQAKRSIGLDIVLTNGSPIKLNNKHRIQFDFDQHGIIVKHFNIKQVPAFIVQHGQHMKIAELLPNIGNLQRILR